MKVLKSAAAMLVLAAMTAMIWAGSDGARAAEPAFSGKTETYSDTYNGFKLTMPVEFKLGTKGATTDFTGPMVDNFATLIYINTVEMKGVPSKVLYDTNIKSKKDDRAYTDVKPVKIKSGVKGDVYAFTCSEANHPAGNPDEKKPDDIHRWHLFVFGNGRFYTCGFTGSYQAFKDKSLPPIYTAVINSFELIATK